MTKAQTILRRCISVVAIYAVLCVAAGITLAEFSVHLPKRTLVTASAQRQRIWRQFHAPVHDVSLTAADGATMRAWFIQPNNPNGKAVILLHGITDNRTGIAGFGDIFLQQGYSILVPDSREHGDSGGNIATYGILERDDVRRWVSWTRQRAPGCTYLLGESMGAAIGLQATAVTPQLCAVAVESPYATFRKIGFERLGWETHLGTMFWRTLGRPVVITAIAYTHWRYGIYLPDADPEAAVRQSHVPSLLIAGTIDKAIPMHNALELKQACNHCALWIVPGADHGGASSVARVEFQRRILDWFQRYGGPSTACATQSPARARASTGMAGNGE